ncbi:MAG: RNA polymerase subunit sigma [Planctomycetaceae bacterium]|nr:RNA polymerase subunit sigma [Planctomycetaceae bacterium]
MADVTQILGQIEDGDPSAAEKLLPLVYEELRKLAAARLNHEAPGHTLQATALVHEAYLRLVDSEDQQDWDSRGHFFSAAAEAMRRILIENARRKSRVRHGGAHQRSDLDEAEIVISMPTDRLLALDEALGRLAEVEPQKAELVKLRFFAGLTLEQAADAIGVSRATATRHWTYARAWLYDAVSQSQDSR